MGYGPHPPFCAAPDEKVDLYNQNGPTRTAAWDADSDVRIGMGASRIDYIVYMTFQFISFQISFLFIKCFQNVPKREVFRHI